MRVREKKELWSSVRVRQEKENIREERRDRREEREDMRE